MKKMTKEEALSVVDYCFGVAVGHKAISFKTIREARAIISNLTGEITTPDVYFNHGEESE